VNNQGGTDQVPLNTTSNIEMVIVRLDSMIDMLNVIIKKKTSQNQSGEK
jgi:hypothetical protein